MKKEIECPNKRCENPLNVENVTEMEPDHAEAQSRPGELLFCCRTCGHCFWSGR